MKLYNELADWWPLLSPPDEYEEEAATYRTHLMSAGDAPCRTVLELGSGGGNNASHLKQHFAMTLVDVSERMLEVSRRLNPECDHLQGDMRTVRLHRQFDRVFVHDAICYMTTAEDLRRAVHTAFVHCRPGGGALFAPDCVRETFRESTNHGGSDGPRRSLRYLEWTWDPDPTDTSYQVDYVYALRSDDGTVNVEHDQHTEGVFSRDLWLDVLREVGFHPRVATFEHSEVEGALDLFVGQKYT